MIKCIQRKDGRNEKSIKNVLVECNDKGALDFTIKARLLCALERYFGE